MYSPQARAQSHHVDVPKVPDAWTRTTPQHHTKAHENGTRTAKRDKGTTPRPERSNAHRNPAKSQTITNTLYLPGCAAAGPSPALHTRNKQPPRSHHKKSSTHTRHHSCTSPHAPLHTPLTRRGERHLQVLQVVPARPHATTPFTTPSPQNPQNHWDRSCAAVPPASARPPRQPQVPKRYSYEAVPQLVHTAALTAARHARATTILNMAGECAFCRCRAGIGTSSVT